MKEIGFRGHNDYPLCVSVWDEVESPKAIVQISHGMVEYMGRYDGFARFLNSKGYIVIGDDHRAHGKTCQGPLGTVPKDGDCFIDTVEDLAMLTKYAKETYNLPVILFGHSYGSFLTQEYIQKHSDLIEAAIICGSAKKDGIDGVAGRVIAHIQQFFLGKDKPAKMVAAMSFGMYEKPFKSENRKFAWGSRDVESCEKYNNDPLCQYTCSLGFYTSMFDAFARLYKKENLKSIRKDLPLFLIAGDADPVGNMGKAVVKLYQMYVDLGINTKIKLYEGARHELTNETNKEEVYKDVLAFCDEIIK